MKKKTKRTATKKPAKPTLVVMVLDRTGSMANCKQETIKGYNAYVDALRKSPSMRMTLVQFDSAGIDTVQAAVPIKDAIRLSDDNYIPRALTPLYDAVGKTIEDTKKSAEKCDVLFVTLTDGIENASINWSYEKVQHAITECEANGWAFAHIGVGANGWAAGQHLYAQTQSIGNVLRTDGKNIARSMARAGGQAVHYASVTGLAKSALKVDFFAGKNDDTLDED